MKKYLLLLLLLIPFSVFAKDTCDVNAIKIQSIELENSTGHIEELNESSISNQKINLGLKMDVVGDSAEYKIVVKNNSNEDYYFDKRALNIDMESVNYEVSFDDNTNLMKAGEEKIVYLKVSYKVQMNASNFTNGIYDGNQVVKLNFMTMENPFTGRFLGLFVFISLVIGFFVLYKDKKKTSYLLLIIGLILPFTVKAVCKYSLEVNTNLVIDAKNAIFLPGSEFNIKVKQLVGDDTSSSSYGYDFKDELITAFHYSDDEPIDSNKEDKNIVSVSESGYPIYVWFDNGVIYWWSEDKTPALNEDASAMFMKFSKLDDISGLSNIDSSGTTSLSSFFAYTSVSSFVNLSNWNTSNNTSLLSFAAYNKAITSTDGIENWNVSNVLYLTYMFHSCFNLETVDFSNWSTPSLTRIDGIFAMVRDNSAVVYDGKIKNIYLSDKFDTSNVTLFTAFLEGNDEIEDYSFLQYLDTSKAVNMNGVFVNNTNLRDDQYFKDWDVSNVTNFHIMFSNTSIKNLDLSKWKTSNATDLGYTFYSMPMLEELDISNFDTRNVITFREMFSNSNKLKHIYVGENWDTSANTNANRDIFPSNCNLPNFSKSNPNYRNLSYAHTGEGGYLTLKTN